MQNHFLIFFLLIIPFLLGAQNDEEVDNRKTEIGLNVTNTLAGFFNAGGDALPTDRYLFSLKFSNPKGAVRFGMNFGTRSNNEFVTTGRRDVAEHKALFRGGYEWRKDIDYGFVAYYGLDVLGEWEFERNSFDNFNLGNITSRKTILGFGGGPILGIQYRLSKNIAFSTEAAVYGVYQVIDDYQELGNGLPPEEDTSTSIIVSPSIPSSLYLIMMF